MSLWQRWRARTGRVNDLDEEIEAHLRMAERDRKARGETALEARAGARREFGNVLLTREVTRAQWRGVWIEHAMQDFRFALRQLLKSRAFGAASIFVLALGMCASIAIFAFVSAALIKPLPYPDPKSLVSTTESAANFRRANLSYPDYQDWKRLNTVFRSLDVYRGAGFLLRTSSGAVPVSAARVSGGFFRTLGIAPMLGRDFPASEESPGNSHLVILSYGSWIARFGGAKDIVGRSVTLSGELYTVAGVLPKNFQFAPTGAAELWTTIDPNNQCDSRRSCHDLFGVARLKDGVSIARAQANLQAIANQLERQYPDSNRERGAQVNSCAEDFVGNYRPTLLGLLGGAQLLLLIACANVTSLVLVRAESRRREMAVRSALGASRARLVGQFAAESMVLVLIAGSLALLFAKWTIQVLKGLVPATMLPSMPFIVDLGMDWRVLAYTCAAALLAALVFALTPSLHLAISGVAEGLAEGSRGSSGRAWRRLGSRLVVAELAIAMVLLVGSGLLGKSLYRLLHVQLNIRPDHLATITVAAPDVGYDNNRQKIRLARDIVSAIEALPGVRSAAVVTQLPVSYNGNTDWIRFVGKPYDGKHIEVNERDASAEYFQTIGAKLLRGRFFTDAEDESKAMVVIVNRTLANKYFPGEDPIGRQIGDTSLSPKSIKTIIGVVDDIREGELDSDIWPAEYHPFNQDPGNYFSVIVRTSQKPEAILPSLNPAIHRLYADVGTDGEATMEGTIDRSPTAYLHRSSAWLVGGFAVLALLLGAVGLYGAIAYSVSQRTREIGVRVALGAGRQAIYRLILREAGRLVVLGVALGIASSITAATVAQKLLFGVSSWDLPTLASVASILGVAAGLASFLPARRAASVNPVEALRTE